MCLCLRVFFRSTASSAKKSAGSAWGVTECTRSSLTGFDHATGTASSGLCRVERLLYRAVWCLISWFQCEGRVGGGECVICLEVIGPSMPVRWYRAWVAGRWMVWVPEVCYPKLPILWLAWIRARGKE